MKLIVNGITCESVDNNCSSATLYRFDSPSDALMAFHGEYQCGYCQIHFHPVMVETVNGKIACPNCREELVKPIVGYMDRHKVMWSGKRTKAGDS